MFYYVLELVVVFVVLLTIFSYVYNGSPCAWITEINSFDFIEKVTVILIIYQLIVLLSLTLYDSVRKDALLSKINIFNFALINLEYDNPFVQMDVIKEKLVNNHSIDYKKTDHYELAILVDIYDNYLSGEVSRKEYEFYIKNTLISLQHQFEYYDLSWRGSVLLRLIK